MTNVFICGLSEINQFVPRVDQVVSLIDTDLNKRAIEKLVAYVASYQKPHLIRQFDDVYAPFDDFVPPSLLDVDSVLSWVKPEKSVLVHCHAGQSRSTAMAIGLMLCRGSLIKDAINEVYKQRWFAKPNFKIIDHIETLFGYHKDITIALTNYNMMSLMTEKV